MGVTSKQDPCDSVRELKARALRYLARREHSRAELLRKLSVHATSMQDVEGVLKQLESAKLLSDARFAEIRVNQLQRKFGAERIRRVLRKDGIAVEETERALSCIATDEIVRARAIVARKFVGLGNAARVRARCARFLLMRGFSTDVIRSVLGEYEDEFGS